MAEKSMQWKDPEIQRKLLLSILASLDSTTYSANKVAEFMGCTAKAVTHQLPKVRSDIEALRKGEFVSTPATPVPSSKKRTAAPAKSKFITNGNDDGNDATAEDGGSPTKKVKTPGKSKTVVPSTPKHKDAEEETTGDQDDSDIDDSAKAATAESSARKKKATPKSPTKKPATVNTSAAKKSAAKKTGSKVKKDSAAAEDDAEMEIEESGSSDEIAKRKDAAEGRIEDED